MPTLKALQRLHRIKKDGTAEIVIRITHKRKIVYVRTGYYVKPLQLKDGTVVKHMDASLINAAIEKKKSEILQNIIKQDLLNEGINIGKAAGKRPDSAETMIGAIKHVMKGYEAKGNAASYHRMKTNLDYVLEAWGRDKYLTDITKLDVEKFANYRYSKGNSHSTVKKNLNDLGSVLNHVDFKGANIFHAFAKKIKATPVKREKLTDVEIKMLEDVKLTGSADLARDMYLFSFYAHGCRFENVATIKREYIRNGYINYRMNKGLDVREIAIHPKLKAIIDKYISAQTLYLFPVVKQLHNDWNKKEIISNANSLINKFLLCASRTAGIEKHISFHTARHTFAYLSKTKMVNVNVIQDALGHSKQSTTQGYLKSLSDDVINEELKRVYE